MGKIAFLFAGQGAQYIGMGKGLYENFSSCRKIFDKASESLKRDLTALCFEGRKEILDQTENTQPAVVAMSLAAYQGIKEYGISPDVVAGLSLGEYSALATSGAFTLEEVIPLVEKRGRFMQKAVPVGVGKMVAILGLSEDKVREVCEEAKSYGIVEPANFNCPGQIVIGGEVKATDQAALIAKQKGALRTLDLPVSAPFHTSLLKPAADRLKVELDQISIGQLQIPVVSNVTADYIGSAIEVPSLLYQQVMGSVLWEQSIRRMIADGVSTFVELGPGKTLSSFVRKIDRKLAVHHVEDLKSLEETVSTLKGKNE